MGGLERATSPVSGTKNSPEVPLFEVPKVQIVELSVGRYGVAIEGLTLPKAGLPLVAEPPEATRPVPAGLAPGRIDLRWYEHVSTVVAGVRATILSASATPAQGQSSGTPETVVNFSYVPYSLDFTTPLANLMSCFPPLVELTSDQLYKLMCLCMYPPRFLPAPENWTVVESARNAGVAEVEATMTSAKDFVALSGHPPVASTAAWLPPTDYTATSRALNPAVIDSPYFNLLVGALLVNSNAQVVLANLDTYVKGLADVIDPKTNATTKRQERDAFYDAVAAVLTRLFIDPAAFVGVIQNEDVDDQRLYVLALTEALARNEPPFNHALLPPYVVGVYPDVKLDSRLTPDVIFDIAEAYLDYFSLWRSLYGGRYAINRAVSKALPALMNTFVLAVMTDFETALENEPNNVLLRRLATTVFSRKEHIERSMQNKREAVPPIANIQGFVAGIQSAVTQLSTIEDDNTVDDAIRIQARSALEPIKGLAVLPSEMAQLLTEITAVALGTWQHQAGQNIAFQTLDEIVRTAGARETPTSYGGRRRGNRVWKQRGIVRKDE